MFYNDDIKTEFLNTLKDPSLHEHIFTRSRDLEETISKDLHSFDGTELTRLFRCFDIKKESSFKRLLRSITNYRTWCINNNQDVTEYTDYKVDLPFNIGNRMFGSPDDLEAFLNDVLDSVDMNTTDLIYRGVSWLVFGGLPVEEVIELKQSGVNLKNANVTTGSHKGIIYPQAKKTIKKLCDLDHFFYMNPVYKDKGMIIRTRLESEYLLRGIRAPKQALTTLVTSSPKILTRSDGVTTTYRCIELSGYFFRAYEQELNGFDIGIEFMLKDYARRELMKRFDAGDSSFEKKLLRRLKLLIADYNNWKDTFYPTIVKDAAE